MIRFEPMTGAFLAPPLRRLLLLRLRGPPPPPADLAALAGELEEAARSHAVTLVLQRRPDEPAAALVAALPSRDLSWELTRLRAQGFAALPEASCELSLCEGDLLVLRFSGNITAKGQRSPRWRPRFPVQRTEVGGGLFQGAARSGGCPSTLSCRAASCCTSPRWTRSGTTARLTTRAPPSSTR